VSKIQTAIQKMMASPERRPGDSTDSASIRSAMRSEKRHNDSRTLKYKQKIEIDFDVLTADGVATSAEHERELRDEIRHIKWPVLANAFGGQREKIPCGNVVMVASAMSGEGKTFAAFNLAMSIAAEKDVDVLLVDADIAKHHASELFGLTEYPGVIDYLSGDVSDIADVIVGTDVPGLSLLPAGAADEHAPELIASNRMSDLVAGLSSRFPSTVVLFDTSPLLQTNESQVLSRIVGQVLLVVAANKTPQEAVKEAVSLLGHDLVVNVVFNGMIGLIGRKYHYGDYYAYQPRR